MRISVFVAGALVSLAIVARPSAAHACGGCFSSPQNPTVVTDHRMILSVSLAQTTLYDQIRYAGAPDSFAWVLPIKGVAQVGLSADLVFDTLDALTHTTVYAPPRNCPSPPPNCYAFGGADASASADGAGGVQVLTQAVVGPYETVQLASTDPQALSTWLTGHGYEIPTDIQPVINAYVNEGFDFLALKLVPGASVQAMRPVRVTTQGASPVLPLRMVAAGTGTSVGITLWVVGEGRYEPENFPFFRIDDSELVWDYATSSSNYAALRAQKEQAANQSAWELESSLPLTQSSFTSYVDNGGTSYPYYGYDAGRDYEAIGATDGGDGGGETASQVRDDDLATLFSGINPSDTRVTRIRADLGRIALSKDLTLQASASQDVLTNQRFPYVSVNAPQCPTYGTCPNGYDDGGTAPSVWGSGCNAAPQSDGDDVLFALGGVGLMAAFGLARRRKR